MKRDIRQYLEDIIQSIANIEKYIKSVKKDSFYQDQLVQDGVIRRLEIIGEAVRQLPKEILRQYPDVPWQKIAGLRNRLSHEYFGIILDPVVDYAVVKNGFIYIVRLYDSYETNKNKSKNLELFNKMLSTFKFL